MTETVNEQSTTESVENLPALPPLLAANYDVLVQLSHDASSIARRIKAQGNEAQLIADVLETSDDEKVQKFNAWVEQLENQRKQAEDQIAQYIRETLLPKNDDVLDVDKATVEYKTKRKNYQDLLGALRGVVEPADFASLEKRLPEMESLGRKSGGGSTGTGIKRTRIDEILVKSVNAPDSEYKPVTKDVKDPKTQTVEKKTSFGILSEYLSKLTGNDIDQALLREHADAEAGTSDWKSLNGKPFTFAFRASDEHNLMIRVTPRPAPSSQKNDES